jgi:hypothetical protein
MNNFNFMFPLYKLVGFIFHYFLVLCYYYFLYEFQYAGCMWFLPASLFLSFLFLTVWFFMKIEASYFLFFYGLLDSLFMLFLFFFMNQSFTIQIFFT